MDELITIALERYEDLLNGEGILEALEDAYTMKVVAEHLANPTEGLPDRFMGRLLDGENPVFVYRDWRGWTQTELARQAGLHRVQIHYIETGKRRGSVDPLKKIAEALRVPLDLIA